MSDRYTECAAAIVRAGRFAAARGWVPATSGNFSMRLDAGHLAITESGVDKGTLGPHQILVVDRAGKALEPGRRASAETALHWEAYERDPAIGAVAHTHSLSATVLSRAAALSTCLMFEGYELAKAFAGVTDHRTRLELPIVENDQDIGALARAARAAIQRFTGVRGYLIRGHGAYVWGRDMDETLRHLEALEFLLACALEEGKLRA